MPDKFDQFEEFYGQQESTPSTVNLLDRIQKESISRENYVYTQNIGNYVTWGKIGSYWFYLVAAFTVVSNLITMLGEQRMIFFGLGISRFIDLYALLFIEQLGPEYTRIAFTVAFLINLILASVLVLFGYLSDHNHPRIHMIGTILYGIDFFICLFGGKFLYAAFHILGLFFLIRSTYGQKKLYAI